MYLRTSSPCGSSPRAWGRCSAARYTGRRYPVHPHVRGADISFLLSTTRNTRFIPTCVGQMPHAITLPPIKPVHPHVRGADVYKFLARIAAHGSSPRAWGRCSSLWYRRCCCRFIPTCVGQMQWAVPRSPLPSRFIPTCVGQMLVVLLGNTKGTRFIPTCVGQIAQYRQAHHRRAGSSPRAWGRCEPPRDLAQRRRFIPTCVGQMRFYILRPQQPTRFIPTCVGQILSAQFSIRATARFIPTCVGQIQRP